MKILVLNCGSSSIKYQLLNISNPENADLLAKGLVERIGICNGELSHKTHDNKKHTLVAEIPDHTKGIDIILEALLSPEYGVIKSLDEINAVGHRVAHGGQYFSQSASSSFIKDIASSLRSLVIPTSSMISPNSFP